MGVAHLGVEDWGSHAGAHDQRDNSATQLLTQHQTFRSSGDTLQLDER
jgi:hypothetical protein